MLTYNQEEHVKVFITLLFHLFIIISYIIIHLNYLYTAKYINDGNRHNFSITYSHIWIKILKYFLLLYLNSSTAILNSKQKC